MHSVGKRILVVMMMKVDIMVQALVRLMRWQSPTFIYKLVSIFSFLLLIHIFVWTDSFEFAVHQDALTFA